MTEKMEKERSVDRLARYILCGVVLSLAMLAGWYFRSILLYVVIAAVVSLMGKPAMHWLMNVRIGKRQMPSWLAAVFTVILLMTVFLFVFVQVIPVVVSIAQRISDNLAASDYSLPVASFTVAVDGINEWLISHFPQLGYDFRIESAIGGFLRKTLDLSSVSSIVESVASFFVSVGVGIFSIVFISFFFIKDPMLFRHIVGALVPDRIERRVMDAIGDIEHLLSRYFIGLFVEVLGVATLDFLGLWLIAGIGFNSAVGIAFIAGILNVIPYVGPLFGTVTGTLLATVLKFTAAGQGTGFCGFVLLVIVIFMLTQLVDNFVFQPLIYSTSIKASPLEIFIVLLIAGNLAGVMGMLVAIPAYTVIRVIASHFFMDVKAIRRLISNKL